MQIKYREKLNTLKCCAKWKSTSFLEWESQILYQHLSKSKIHKPKLVQSIKLLNHLLKAKIEYFKKYLQAALWYKFITRSLSC